MIATSVSSRSVSRISLAVGLQPGNRGKELVDPSANPPLIDFSGYWKAENKITLAVSPSTNPDALTVVSGNSGIALPSDHPVEEVTQQYSRNWSWSPPPPAPGGDLLEANVRPKTSSR